MHRARKAIKTLVSNHVSGLAGSIYIPTHQRSTNQNIAADRTRFKNAIQRIRLHKDYDETKLGGSLKKLDKIYDDMEFWKYQDHGLAVLFDKESVEYFKLPFEVREAEYLNDHFVISPLIIMSEMDTRFYVLDLNLTRPRLLYGAHGELEEVNQENMPGSLDDEVGKDEYRRQLQHQSIRMNAYHGHSEEDVIDDETRRYIKQVATAVDNYLHDKQVPLLLAGTDNRTDGLRKELEYTQVLPNSHSGNVERLNARDLRKVVAPLIQDYLADRLNQAVDRLQKAAPQYVIVGKQEIMEAVSSEGGGRVESLYLPIYRVTKDSVMAGDNTSLLIELPDDIETIESLVISVDNQGGKIVPVEIGAHKSIDEPKALCRY